MGRIIAIANQKGGVGKTTTAVNLTAALANLGKNVLLIDCDPQGNATSGMGVRKTTRPNIYDILINGVPAENCVVRTKHGYVIPSNKELSGATVELVEREQREYILREALQDLQTVFDIILLDCPPSLELLTINALAAAQSVIIPMQCEYFALEGLADLMTTIKLCRRSMNPGLKIEGIVLTMYDNRTKLTEQVAYEIKNYFGGTLYKTKIPRSVRMSEAPSHGKPGIVYDKSNKASKAYCKLAEEVLKREKKLARKKQEGETE